MVLMIKDEAIPRIRLLAAEMGWDFRMARGCMDELWGNSQSAGVTHASKQVIIALCSETNPEVGERLFKALQLEHIKFISKAGDDLWEIRGNKNEIEKVARFKEAKKLAADSGWEKRKAKLAGQGKPGPSSKTPPKAASNAPADADAMHVHSSSNAPADADAMPKLNQAKLNQAKPSQAELNQAEHSLSSDDLGKLYASELIGGARHQSELVKKKRNAGLDPPFESEEQAEAYARQNMSAEAWAFGIKIFASWDRFVLTYKEQRDGGYAVPFEDRLAEKIRLRIEKQRGESC